MKIYKITIFAITITTALSLSAQDAGKIKKGKKHFDSYSYSKAIEKYEPIAQKTTDINRTLADSYTKIRDTEKAEIYYAEVVKAEDKTPEDVYGYAAILSKNGKYKEAEEWMKTYNSLAKNDSRAIQYSSKPGHYKTLLKDEKRFSIKNIDANSAQEDFGPAYYKDKVVFASSREGTVSIKRTWNWNQLPFLDMYEATASEDNELSELTELSKGKKNKKYHEGPVSFNKEGTYMVFTRNNYKGKSEDGIIKLQLFSSEMKDGKWQKEVALPYNNNEYSVGHASLTADGNTMYFASDMPGGTGGVDLYKASKNEDGTWGEAQNLGNKINTEGNEMFPFIHKDDMLFFASDGHLGLGGLDIFIAQVKGNDFGKIQNVGVPVNGSKDDFSFILDEESKKGYFASNRSDGKGDDDIYSFNLLKPFTFGKIIKGTAKDKKGTILDSTLITLYDEEGNSLETVTTNENGEYQFTVEPDLNFELDGKKSKFFDGTNTATTITEEDVIIADLTLEKDPGLSLYAIITDKKTGNPLEGVKMTIIDNMTGVKIEYLTPNSGSYRKPLAEKKLNDKGSYNIILEKDGYFSKTVTYNTEFTKPGVYEINSVLDLALDPEVKDLAQLIEINPINFDLNKYKIRPDAAIELDKIVAVMNKYPEMEVELGSHTDARGSDAYNRKLSDRRAKASAAYIKKHITNPERIYGKGYGETQIINKCVNGVQCTDEEHEVNRRTEFKVISTGNDKINIKNSSTDSFEK